MKVLILYASTHGQTRKVALFMESLLKEQGIRSVVADLEQQKPSPSGFDLLLIGGSVHLGKYQKSLKKYIEENATELNKKSTAFFSVCLSVASDKKEQRSEAEQVMRDFLRKTKWKPEHSLHVAGALNYTKYNFLTRFVMKRISKKEGRSTDTSRDHEYTDWEEVKSFVLQFVEPIFQ